MSGRKSLCLLAVLGFLAAGCGPSSETPAIRDEGLRIYDDVNQIVQERKSAPEHLSTPDLDLDGDADAVLTVRCGCTPSCRIVYDVVFLNRGGKYSECGHITLRCDGRLGTAEYGTAEGVFARFTGEECFEESQTEIEGELETVTGESKYYRVKEDYVLLKDKVVLKRRWKSQISMNELKILPRE
jgi:hypothetical protein